MRILVMISALLVVAPHGVFAAALTQVVADEFQRFHPAWITRSSTSHDAWGGNGDNQKSGLEKEGGYQVLFHAKGEGRILRLWMTCPREKVASDYQELWIMIDGHTAYKGSPLDFFEGRAGYRSPLVMGFDASSGAFLSYVPFGYAREAKVLFKGDPHYYQVTYREGEGSSHGPSAQDLHEAMSGDGFIPPQHDTHAELAPLGVLELARGPLTVRQLSLRIPPQQLSRLFVRLGIQPAVPAPFFFGLGGVDPRGEWTSFSNVFHRMDFVRGVVSSRLPIPLAAGESLVMESSSQEMIPVSFSVETGPALPGTHLVAQYKDQWAPGQETTMSFFDSNRPVQIVSLIEEISEGQPGRRQYLEGDEMIRVDQMEYPLQLGTGTEDYFNGGWYFLSTHANPLAGFPRFEVIDPADGWSHALFEQSLYRHHLVDPIIGRKGARLGFEAGETGAYAPARYRTLVFAYEFDAIRLLNSVTAKMTGAAVRTQNIDSSFDAERVQNIHRLEMSVLSSGRKAGFEIACVKGATAVLMTRTYDAKEPEQQATVSLGKVRGSLRKVGGFFEAYRNPIRRFAQDSLWADLLPGECETAGAMLRVELDAAGSATDFTGGTFQVDFFI